MTNMFFADEVVETSVGGMIVMFVPLALLIAAIVFTVVSVRRGRRRRAEMLAFAPSPQAAEMAAMTERIRKWTAAYEQAHGQAPPPGWTPPPMAARGGAASDRTNVCAVLALIFGATGGLLGIILGFVALSQIKRTGERGHGMAVAGLVMGFTWLVVSAGLLIWMFSGS